MANTIDSSLVVMKERSFWPGSPLPLSSLPLDGWVGANHHNVVAAAYPVGTKIMAYHANTGALGAAGWYGMIYLRVGVQHADSLIAAKSVCCPIGATMLYTVTNDVATAVSLTCGGLIALSAMTDAYYGWFLYDGVCPTDAVAGLDGNILTDGTLTAMCGLIGAASAATPHIIGLSILLETSVLGGFGISITADA